MPDEIVVTTTSDSQAVAQEVASDNGDGRATVAEGTLSNFRETKSEDGKTVTTSYERPDSERGRLLERLAQEENAIAFPSAEEGSEATPEAEQPQTEQLPAPLNPADTLDGFMAANPELSWEEAQTLWSQMQRAQGAADYQHRQIIAEHNGRMAAAQQNAEYAAAMQQAGEIPQDIVLHPAVLETIAAQPNSPALMLAFAQRPDLARGLAQMPVSRALAQVAVWAANLAANFQAQQPRTASRAPAPIRPLSGSPTRATTNDPSEMSFSDFKKWRQRTGRR